MRWTVFAALAALLWLVAPAGAQQPPSAMAAAANRSGGTTWDKIAGNWKSLRGNVRQQWGKLTNNDVAIARGRRDVLVGRIQARYGIDKEIADAQVEAWLKQQK